MKNLKNLLLIAVLMLGLGGVANAQKVGHINAEKLIANMPETKALKSEMEKLQKTYKDEIDAKAKKLEAKYKKYEAEAKTQTKEMNAKRAQEIQAENASIEQARQLAYKDMQERQNKKLNPIFEKAQKAIQDVAAEKGIQYIFDASPGKGLLVFEKGVDIFDAVKAKLGF